MLSRRISDDPVAQCAPEIPKGGARKALPPVPGRNLDRTVEVDDASSAPEPEGEFQVLEALEQRETIDRAHSEELRLVPVWEAEAFRAETVPPLDEAENQAGVIDPVPEGATGDSGVRKRGDDGGTCGFRKDHVGMRDQDRGDLTFERLHAPGDGEPPSCSRSTDDHGTGARRDLGRTVDAPVIHDHEPVSRREERRERREKPG